MIFKNRKRRKHRRRHSSPAGEFSLGSLETKAPLPEETFDIQESPMRPEYFLSSTEGTTDALDHGTSQLHVVAQHTHYHHRRRRNRKKKTLKRVLLGLGTSLFVVLFIGMAVAMAGVQKINTELALPVQEVNDLKKVLAKDDVTTQDKTSNAYYVLLVGLDSRSADEYADVDEGRTDIMLLARVDPDNGALTLVSVPRDTPWVAPDGKTRKINSALNQGGPALVVQAVNNLTGIKISHYVEVNFLGFEAMVDTIGGISVNVPQQVVLSTPVTGELYTLQPGEQILNGWQARALARTRKQYAENQDASRQEAVRQIILGIIQAAKDKPVYELPLFAQTVAQYVGTDLSVNEMATLAPSIVKCKTVYQVSGPFDGGQNPHFSNVWFCYENPQGWAHLMELVDAGKDPTGINYQDFPSYPAGSKKE